MQSQSTLELSKHKNENTYCCVCTHVFACACVCVCMCLCTHAFARACVCVRMCAEGVWRGGGKQLSPNLVAYPHKYAGLSHIWEPNRTNIISLALISSTGESQLIYQKSINPFIKTELEGSIVELIKQFNFAQLLLLIMFISLIFVMMFICWMPYLHSLNKEVRSL